MMPIAESGRPFLDYSLSTLADAGWTDVLLVVAPDHGRIRDYYTRIAPPRRLILSFAVQAEPRGTADALLAAEAVDGRRPLPRRQRRQLVSGVGAARACDDGRRRHVALCEGRTRRAQQHSARTDPRVRALPPGGGWVARLDCREAGRAGSGTDDLVSMNCWLMPPGIFEACRSISPSARGELEIADAVTWLDARAARALPRSIVSPGRRARPLAAERRRVGRRARSPGWTRLHDDSRSAGLGRAQARRSGSKNGAPRRGRSRPSTSAGRAGDRRASTTCRAASRSWASTPTTQEAAACCVRPSEASWSRRDRATTTRVDGRRRRAGGRRVVRADPHQPARTHWQTYPCTVVRRIARELRRLRSRASTSPSAATCRAPRASAARRRSSSPCFVAWPTGTASTRGPSGERRCTRPRTSPRISARSRTVDRSARWQATPVSARWAAARTTRPSSARSRDGSSTYRFSPVTREAEVALADRVFVVAASGITASKASETRDRVQPAVRTLATLEQPVVAAHRRRADLARARDRRGSAVPSNDCGRSSAPRPTPRFPRTSFAIGSNSSCSKPRRSCPKQPRRSRHGTSSASATLVDESQRAAERWLDNQIHETMTLASEARRLGADAASAFGAGFGGSVWALVAAPDAERFTTRLARRVHRGLPGPGAVVPSSSPRRRSGAARL